MELKEKLKIQLEKNMTFEEAVEYLNGGDGRVVNVVYKNGDDFSDEFDTYPIDCAEGLEEMEDDEEDMDELRFEKF